MLKFINHHWQLRRERFYLKNRWHLILDFSLGIIILLLIGVVISLHFYRPSLIRPFVGVVPTKSEIDLNNPPLVVNFTVASSSISLADGAVLKIDLKNTGDSAIQSVKIDLLSTKQNFAINKIEATDEAANIKIINRQIDLGSLNINESREVTFRVYFRVKNEMERVIHWQAQSAYLVQGQLIKEIVDLPNLNLTSELDAEAAIYYHSPQGDQLGSGPLPPLVGLPTNYWVFFEIKSNGDFKDLVFSAKLPKGVELTDNRSLLSGDFKYNAASRQIIWRVAELKNQNDSYRVGFEIQFTPNLSQVDKVVPLITNLNYYARDIVINEEISAWLPNLSTNLDFDRLNRGEGTIGQP